MGVVSDLGATWCNASYFWTVPEARGPLAFVSQSGAMGGMFFAEVRARGWGFSRFVSLGNAADVNETDVLEWLGADEATGVIALFCEQITGGRRFVEVARDVSRRKPIVVLKAGKGESGTRAALSHTGSIAGSHGAARAAFARAGAIEAPDSDAFFDTLAVLSAGVRPTTNRRLAILTISGGPGVLAADAAERLGAEMPAPSQGVASRLRELLPEFAALTNPIDLTPQCAPASFGPAIDAVFDDPAFDAVVVIDCGLDVAEFGAGVARAAERTGRPVTAFVLDVPNVAAALDRAGIARFTSPERAVGALVGVRP
jgi:acetyltransferase